MFLFFTWFWRDDTTSICLINLIWVESSKCTCLASLLVIPLMEMKILILISVLTWIPQKILSWLPRSIILRQFQNNEYRFPFPKSHTLLAEKQQEEHRQLQSVMCLLNTTTRRTQAMQSVTHFTQTHQNRILVLILMYCLDQPSLLV